MGKVLVALIVGLSFSLSESFSSGKVSPGDSVEFYNWFNLDIKKDGVPGISTDLAYDVFLRDKKSTPVIVAVIDGGVDIHHEDLVGRIWINDDEIPGNGIDDDNNGYIDDVYGWNFLGGPNGENIEHETYEVTRIYRKYKSKFSSADTTSLAGEDLAIFNMYTKARSVYYKKLSKAQKDMSFIQRFETNYFKADSVIKITLNKDTFSIDEIKVFDSSETREFAMAKLMLVSLHENGFKIESLNKYKKHIETKINYHFNLDFDPRSIVNDDPDDPNDSYYGNNDVVANTPEHGTFVSGIIAGDRNNNIGMKGIADNVKIMVLRAVPDGDERDKDVANAIRYAADNGAHIINMSFGKDFSPQKELVDEAIKYAAAKDVLLVHAAGNESDNVDIYPRYPSNQTDSKDRLVTTWLNIGASSKNTDLTFVGSFSNYGIKTVDLFAPGVNVYSLKPDDKYDVLDGTSFASPMTAGAAALMKSYYPQLTAQQLKEIILASTVSYKKQKVLLPSKEENKKPKKIKFKKLSATGGLLNVYKALELCEEYTSVPVKQVVN